MMPRWSDAELLVLSRARAIGTSRDRRLRTVYGIDLATYEAMAKAQGYKCAICPTPHTEASPLLVDHCHVTGKVRGLLCRGCNLGLGNFKDVTGYLLAAVAYLYRAQGPEMVDQLP